MPINSRRKGAKGEREVRDLLREFGFEAERAGRQGLDADVRCSIPGLHIEVKRRETYDLGSWLRQAESDMLHFEREQYAVFHRRNEEPWRATVDARFLLELLALRERCRDC